MTNEPPELVVADAAGWRAWLVDHHGEPLGVWLILAKKGTVEPTSLTYDQALDEALCQGWIDGQTRRHDEAHITSALLPSCAEQLVETQRWNRGTADGAGQDAVGWSCRGGACQGRRPLGRRLRRSGRHRVPADLAAALAAEPSQYTLLYGEVRLNVTTRLDIRMDAPISRP